MHDFFGYQQETIKRNNTRFSIIYPDGKTGIYSNPQIKTHLNSPQDLWNQYCDDTVMSLAEEFQKQDVCVEKIIIYLANARREIGRKLNHYPDRRTLVGKVRNAEEKERPYERIDDKNWSDFFTSIKKSIETKVNDHNYFPLNETYLDKYDLYTTNADRYKMEIACYLTNGTNNIEFVEVFYPCYDVAEFKKIYLELNKIFKYLLKWDDDNLNLFLKNLGELSYELYRLLPVRLGNSAVVNLLVRGIAEFKGVELSYHKINDLPLDFKAFFTFDRAEYGIWFSENAYQSISYKYPPTIALELKI